MTKQEVLTRLCKLSREVQNHFKVSYATDCFCGGNPLLTRYEDMYRFDETPMKFIEDAVQSAINTINITPTPRSLPQMSEDKIYMSAGKMYHEECMDEQDKISATLCTDVDGDDTCEECGKPLVREGE